MPICLSIDQLSLTTRPGNWKDCFITYTYFVTKLVAEAPRPASYWHWRSRGAATRINFA